jgi:hypothetical protein
LVLEIWGQCSLGKAVYARTSSNEASINAASFGARSRSASATDFHWVRTSCALSCAKIVLTFPRESGHGYGLRGRGELFHLVG